MSWTLTNRPSRNGFTLRVLIFFCIVAADLLAAGETRFEHIGEQQGLMQRHITTLFQDRRGFLWIGTSDGLNRYDGYEFTTFRFDPLDPTAISGNNIDLIYEDRSGYLWIITSGGGINRFNPAGETFTHFHHSPEDSGSLSNDDVSAILEDRAGNLWIGTNGGGLNLLDRESGRFVRVRHDPANPHSLSSNFVSAMLADRQGDIWIGTSGGGLNKMVLPGADSGTGTLLRQDGHADASGLKFIRFYAPGPAYLPAIFDSVQALISRNRHISAIQPPPGAHELGDFFRIENPGDAVIVAMGYSDAFGMTDYGWIEDGANQSVLWEMNYQGSTLFGGKSQRRIQVDLVHLAPGTYHLRYRSSRRNSGLGDGPEQSLWGIQLLQIDPGQKQFFEKQLRRREVPNWLPHNWITALYEDPQGNIWIGTAGGLARLNRSNPGAETFTVFAHEPGNPHSLSGNYVVTLYPFTAGNIPFLAILTSSNDLDILDVRSDQLYRVNTFAGENSPSRDGEKITALWSDSREKLWVGTAFRGLRCLRVLTGRSGDPSPSGASPVRFEQTELRREPGNAHSLSDNAITAILEDRSGILWFGTARGGLSRLNRQQMKFRHIPALPQEDVSAVMAQSLSHPVVTAIVEERDEVLWVGTYGGGLNRLERSRLAGAGPVFTCRFFRHDPADPNSLPGDRVSALYQDQSGNLWVGTHGAGLARMVSGENGRVQFVRYPHQPQTANSLAGNDVNTIYEDQFGQLWIGTNSGLSKFDRLTHRFINYRYEVSNPHSLSDNEVWSIYEDSYSQGKTLWIGTRAGGINKFDRRNNRFIRYTRDFDDPHSLNNPAVLSIYQDRAGNLWFGTYSGGLNKFDRESETFTFFTERNGLANNMIFGILEDRQGNLWLSTNNGLSKFDPQTLAVQNFDVNDGLQANEFSPGAYCLTRRGEMFFGGINGISWFYPDSVVQNSHVPPVVLTGFSVLGNRRDERLSTAQFYQQPIELDYRDNFLSFEFAALDFTNPTKNRYAYRLSGVNEGWVDNGSRRFINFTNLAPGQYEFRVKGSNNDGVWNETGAAVWIIIHPPFWKAWWFITLCAAALVIAGAFLVNWRIQQKLARLMEIEQIRLQERERVRAKAAHDFHDELGHKLTKIALFSEIVKRNLQQASDLTGAPEVMDYLTRIGETAKGLTGGMRDFIWTLDPGRDSLYEVGVRLKDFGDELFDKTGVHFRVEGISPALEKIRLTTDWRRHLTLIFKEAMNNALKHAYCRNVVLSISLENGRLLMILRDDGKGMPEFRPNGSPGTDNSGDNLSTGNGLKNMRMRAQKISGTVDFLPNLPRGTQVQFSAAVPAAN